MRKRVQNVGLLEVSQKYPQVMRKRVEKVGFSDVLMKVPQECQRQEIETLCIRGR